MPDNLPSRPSARKRRLVIAYTLSIALNGVFWLVCGHELRLLGPQSSPDAARRDLRPLQVGFYTPKPPAPINPAAPLPAQTAAAPGGNPSAQEGGAGAENAARQSAASAAGRGGKGASSSRQSGSGAAPGTQTSAAPAEGGTDAKTGAIPNAPDQIPPARKASASLKPTRMARKPTQGAAQDEKQPAFKEKQAAQQALLDNEADTGDDETSADGGPVEKKPPVKPNATMLLKLIKTWTPRPDQKFELPPSLNIQLPDNIQIEPGPPLTPEQIDQIRKMLSSQKMRHLGLDRKQLKRLLDAARQARARKPDAKKDDKKKDAQEAKKPVPPHPPMKHTPHVALVTPGRPQSPFVYRQWNPEMAARWQPDVQKDQRADASSAPLSSNGTANALASAFGTHHAVGQGQGAGNARIARGAGAVASPGTGGTTHGSASQGANGAAGNPGSGNPGAGNRGTGVSGASSGSTENGGQRGQGTVAGGSAAKGGALGGRAGGGNPPGRGVGGRQGGSQRQGASQNAEPGNGTAGSGQQNAIGDNGQQSGSRGNHGVAGAGGRQGGGQQGNNQGVVGGAGVQGTQGQGSQQGGSQGTGGRQGGVAGGGRGQQGVTGQQGGARGSQQGNGQGVIGAGGGQQGGQQGAGGQNGGQQGGSQGNGQGMVSGGSQGGNSQQGGMMGGGSGQRGGQGTMGGGGQGQQGQGGQGQQGQGGQGQGQGQQGQGGQGAVAGTGSGQGQGQGNGTGGGQGDGMLSGESADGMQSDGDAGQGNSEQTGYVAAVGGPPDPPEHDPDGQKGLPGALVLPPSPPVGTDTGTLPDPRPVKKSQVQRPVGNPAVAQRPDGKAAPSQLAAKTPTGVKTAKPSKPIPPVLTIGSTSTQGTFALTVLDRPHLSPGTVTDLVDPPVPPAKGDRKSLLLKPKRATSRGMSASHGVKPVFGNRQNAVPVREAKNSQGVKEGSETPLPATLLPSKDAEVGDGSGLKGEYYLGRNFDTYLLTRADPNIEYDWRWDDSPDSRITPGTDWSIRWTGKIAAPTTETYTFYASADDGVRVWINHRIIIDDWTLHAALEYSNQIQMQAGKQYDIKVEYFESGGPPASVALYWESNSTKRQFIPEIAYFYPLPGDEDGHKKDEAPGQ